MTCKILFAIDGVTFEMDSSYFQRAERFSFDTDLDNISSSFSLSLKHDLNIGQEVESPCELYIEKENGQRDKIFTGYIVETIESESVNDNSLEITGYDKGIDLVECSAFTTKNFWIKKKTSALIEELVKPYGISVNNLMDSDPIVEKFSIQMGEQVINPIDRLTKAAGAIPMINAFGDLNLINTPTQETATFSERYDIPLNPNNIKGISRTKNVSQVFKKYIGLSQSSGNGNRWSKAIISPFSIAEDIAIRRYRLSLFVAESRADRKILQERVNWEAQVRHGRATTYEIDVAGFYPKEHPGKKSTPLLWKRGMLVPLIYPKWNLDNEYLITGVRFSLSSEGELTKLTLRKPTIFAKDPSARIGDN